MTKNPKATIETLTTYLKMIRGVSKAIDAAETADVLNGHLNYLTKLVGEMSQYREVIQHDTLHHMLNDVLGSVSSVRTYDMTRRELCVMLDNLGDKFEIAIAESRKELSEKTDLARRLFEFLAANSEKLAELEGFDDIIDAANECCVELVSPNEHCSTATPEGSLFD